MMKTPQTLSFEPFEKALKTLEAALKAPPKNDLERDGTIQRFEYSFELAWKSIRHLLLALGRADVSASPKPLFRDALEEGLIDAVAPWFGFLEARNVTVHTYNTLTADEVYKKAKEFHPHGKELLKRLKDKAKP